MSCHASRDEAQRSVAGQEHGMIPETFRSAKVLIVDDEPAMVRLPEQLATMGNLLAGVAHELNSPLSVILGRVALFEAAAPDERARECAQGIGEAAERCVRIVRSFLTMARRHPPERGHVALSQVLQDAVELLAYELRVADVEVSFDLAADLPPVWADGHQLQ